jgi:cell division protein FtsW
VATGHRSGRALVRRAAAALDRPLTSYYLLLGASALLLTIGLIMVLSASSVYSYEVNDGDSYAVVRRQLVWVLIGLPCAWLASRLPHRWVRRLAYPGFSCRWCCCC